MACFHPLTAWQLSDRRVVFVERGDVVKSLQLPCGQCIGCRLERSRQWAVRCVHEAQLHEHSVFVTLTYGEGLDNWSLVYRDFQLFMKRLRKAKGRVSFYMCGEYGETYGRPHFHACIFGCFFQDRELLKELPSGSKLYSSVELSRLWPHGFTSIGDVTFESAAYVARYATKSLFNGPGRRQALDRGFIDDETGEFFPAVPEFTRMSLNPAIGKRWFKKFASEVYPRDFVVVNGQKLKPPKYYDKLLSSEVFDVVEWKWKLPFGDWKADVEFGRFARGEALCQDNLPERLAVREVVTKSRLSLKKRSLG